MRPGGSGNRQRCQNQPTMLAKLVASLRPGDILVVTRLDRLARSTIDLLNLLKAVGDHKAAFLSLGERWADTTTAAGRLMLTILGGIGGI